MILARGYGSRKERKFNERIERKKLKRLLSAGFEGYTRVKLKNKAKRRRKPRKSAVGGEPKAISN